LALLFAGPAEGLCWDAAPTVGQAWTWPVPSPVRLMFAVILLAVIAGLVVAATGSTNYRRTRIAALAGIGLISLDCGAPAMVVVVAPSFAWPMSVAIAASLLRLTLTVRALPRVLTA
jgi:hypothetical protein